MVPNQSEKKFFQKSKIADNQSDSVGNFIESYKNRFLVYRRDNSPTAIKYIKGLLSCEKGQANMERMEEEILESEYRAYQHFISNSKWCHEALIGDISVDAAALLEQEKKGSGQHTGYLIDESAHLKKGTESVGVAKQYAGVVGKVENCQVGVYASMVNGTRATLVNARLYLPKAWTEDGARCGKAKIPEDKRTYKTKPQLALEMIDQDVSNGVAFDWIGGDGLYGHNSELTGGLEERGHFYVLDVHKDERVFFGEPVISVPAKKPGRGRTPVRLQANRDSTRLDEYVRSLKEGDWKKEKIRKTAKGWLVLKVHTKGIWVWDGAEPEARKRTLVITKTMEKRPKIKYSFSNGDIDGFTPKEYAGFQTQRYWIERTFDDAKNELGMSDYQVRKWAAWHHHISLVMLASLFLLKEKTANEAEYPLMSMRDARILVIVMMFGTTEQYRIKIKQMQERHRKRKADIDRYYRYERLYRSSS